jgi:hypothetical protein
LRHDAARSSPRSVVRTLAATAQVAPSGTPRVSLPTFSNADLLGAADPALSSALHSHAIGALALQSAGFDTQGLVPGVAPISLMRQVLRASQAEAEGLDTDRAARHLGHGNGTPLPDAVRTRMERAFRHDFSHVRVHLDGGAAEAADALHAIAFAVGRDVYFSRGAWAPGTPQGDTLIAHELTHVVQADEGRLPSAKPGMDVSSPHDAHEVEAVRTAAAVVRDLQSAPATDAPGVMSEATALGDYWSSVFAGPAAVAPSTTTATATTTAAPTLASREQAPGSAAPEAEAEPDIVLIVAGVEVRVTRPAVQGGDAAATVPIEREVIPGLTLRSASITTNEDGDVTSGTLTADVNLGAHLQANGLSIRIGPGGAVSATVDDVAVSLGEGLEANVTLTFAPEGVHGVGTVTADQLGLPDSLGTFSGSLTVQVDSAGVTGSGLADATVDGLGSVHAALTYAESVLSAAIDVTVFPADLPGGVQLVDGTLSGSWTRGQGLERLVGAGSLTAQGWLAAQGYLGWTPDTGAWSVAVDLTQTADRTFDGVVLSNTVVQLRVDEGALTSAEASATVTNERFTGTFAGSWSGDDGVSGAATVTLSADWALTTGLVAVTAKAGGTLTVNVDGDALTEVTGDLPTLVEAGQLVVDGTLHATVDVVAEVVTGTFDGALSADIVLPPDGYGWFVLLAGSAVRVALDPSGAAVNLDAQVRYDRVEGPLFEGTLTNAYWSSEAGTFSGAGTLALARDLVSPEAFGWTVTVPAGATLDASVTEGALMSVMGTVDVQVSDATGLLLTGSVDNVAMRPPDWSPSGAVTLSLARPLVLGPSPRGVQVDITTGTLDGFLQSGALASLEGDLGATVSDAGGALLTSTVHATWEAATGEVSGDGQATLVREVTVAEVAGGRFFIVPGAAGTIEVARSTVQAVEGNLPVQFDDRRGPLLGGIINGRHDLEAGTTTADGTIDLLEERELIALATGDTVFLVPGSGVSASVAENALQSVGGDIKLSLRDAEGPYADVTVDATLDVAGTGAWSGVGSLTNTRDKRVGSFGAYTLFLTEGGQVDATLADDRVTEVSGAIPLRVDDGEGPLLTGEVEGAWSVETGTVSGAATLTLARTLTRAVGGTVELRLLEGSSASAELVDGAFTTLGLDASAEVWTNGSALALVTAEGELDVTTGVILSLDGSVSLLRPIELLDGRMTISGVEGDFSLANDQIVALGGRGAVDVPDLADAHGTFDVRWSTLDGVDSYEGEGTLDLTLIDDSEHGRSLTGEIEGAFSSDGTFSAEGTLSYRMTHLLEEMDATVRIDQELDPELDVRAQLGGTLVDARELFGLEQELIKKQQVPIYGPIMLFYGLKGGMGLNLRALQMRGSFAVNGWRPLSEESDVPEFSTDLELDWGMDFSATLAPYLGIEGNLVVASFGAGLRGEATLDVPIEVSPEAHIEGGADGFQGTLGIGVSIRPTLSLALIPFVEASIPEVKTWTHDFDAIEQPIGELFAFEWSGSYGFGDSTDVGSHPATSIPAPPAQQNTETVHSSAPSLPYNEGGSASNREGGPQLESSSEIAGQQSTGDASLDALLDMLNDIQVLAEGVGALGELVSLVLGVIQATASFGPVGFIVYVTWKIFKGELSWDGIKTAVQKVVAALETAAELLEPHLPDWFNSIVDFFSGDKPGLLDALFGADDAMRDAVYRGDHTHAPPDMRAEMIGVMDGWFVSEDDEECVAEIIVFSAQNGDLNQVLDMCGGADHILDVCDGEEDRIVRDLFDAHGIRYDD